jgi:hypothetical protein
MLRGDSWTAVGNFQPDTPRASNMHRDRSANRRMLHSVVNDIDQGLPEKHAIPIQFDLLVSMNCDVLVLLLRENIQKASVGFPGTRCW